MPPSTTPSLRRLTATVVTLGLSALALGPWPGAAKAPPPRKADPDRLVSRPRPAAPAEKVVKEGTTVRTAAGERRRLRLEGGAVVYVNERTALTVGESGRIGLAAGEVFVEAPAGATVQTPKRAVRGRGGRFAVRAGADGTAVVVASGQAAVSGVKAPLRGGQLLGAKADRPAPAPRVSELLAWARELMGGPLVPASEHAGGSLVVKGADGQEAKLTLRRFHVDVHVEDGFARTTIDQTYFNDSTEQLEGTFYFPLPPDASLSRLAMYVNGQLMEGGMAERDYARNVYERIVYQQRDPALLEWVDGSTFKMRVFPLEGRQEKRLVLSYAQRLPALYGREAYRFPAGHSLGKVGRWSLHARVKGGAGSAWDSPSHALKASKDGADLVLTAELKDAALNTDVVLNLGTAGAPADEAVRFSAAEQGGAQYLMVRYRPGLAGGAAPARRDWVFLVETSGDRDPLLARTQVEVVRALLQGAGPDDTFAVLTAGTRVRAFAKEARPVTPANVQEALAFLEGAHLIGALDLGRALGAAASALEGAKAPHLVHVGSGVAAMGERRQDVLVKKLPKESVYVGVGVGRRWNRPLMKAAAEAAAGYFTQVNPDEPVAWRGFELAATLNTPRLLDVSVADKAGKVRFLPFARVLAQGEEVAAVARVDGEAELPAEVVVRGTVGGKAVERVLPVKGAAKAGHLPRTWASLEIERLLAEDAAKHKKAVVALSKAMYVMTPFTSLLVLESDAMYEEFKVDRGRKDHWALYPAPARIEVVYEPLDGAPGDPEKGVKPDARQVAKTVLVRGAAPVLQWPVHETPRYRGLAATAAESEMLWREFKRLVGVGPLGTRHLAEFERMTTRWMDAVAEEREPDHENVPRSIPALTGRDGRLRMLGGVDPVPAFGGGGATPSGGPAEVELRAIPLARGGEAPLQTFQPAGELASPRLEVTGFVVPAIDYRVDGLPADRALGVTMLGEAASARGRGRGSAAETLLYYRPAYSGDDRLFSDLLQYAPGLNTSAADVRAVLEAEALPGPQSRPGKIDPDARALFAKAKPVGWRAYTVPADGDAPAYTITFDGASRYAWERALPGGLREQVACDGTTLWHLYPDLGLAARRTVSRFHRLAFARAVPWALPRVEDLARGADLVAAGPDAVALVPHRGKGGKDKPYVEARFVFDDGRLAERLLVEMPSKKVLLRETVSAGGVVRRFGGDKKELEVVKGELAAGKAPDLKPDVRKLVVLKLPFRERMHVLKTLKIEKTQYSALGAAEARTLLTADVAENDARRAAEVFQHGLFERGQRQLGLYVLLAAAGVNLDAGHTDVLAEHPDEPLAQYLALYSSPVLRKHASRWAAAGATWGDGFLKRLAQAHALCQRWQAGAPAGATPAQRKAERDRALAFVRTHKGSALAWALLGLVQDRTADEEARKVDVKDAYAALAEAWGLFEGSAGLGALARYERARCLWKAGQGAESRKLFRALHAEALKEGGLLRIDGDFRAALLAAGKGEVGWGELTRSTGAALVKKGERRAALTLAAQCWQLDDRPLAQHLFRAAMADLPAGKERLPLALAGLEFLWQTGQLAEADALLRQLLADPAHAGRADLWRLAEALAGRRDMPARRLECLEKALELEFKDRPKVIRLDGVRSDYGRLLEHYQSLAEALVTLKLPPPAGFTDKVVRAADRWRALDRDGDKACALAARALETLGERELAWDYRTTPVGLRPNEAEPWLGLAEELKRQGEAGLADRAFRAAFEAEPTNAQVLWDRAENLRQSGQVARARALYKELAEGTWQPRFAGLKSQARWALEGK